MSPPDAPRFLSEDPLDVLVVEDDPVASVYLTEILESRGHRVDSQMDGDGVVGRFAESRYALVFLDQMLPDTTGVEICRDLRELSEAEDTIILFVTGSDDQAALEDALTAGADDYVLKPAPPELLHTRIAIAERRVAELKEHRRIEEELRKDSFRDQLTGLGNRQMLDDRVEKSSQRFRRTDDYLFGVMVLDLDGFHRINEEFGSDAGDEVLRVVGARIASCLREEDTVVRLAADEFGVHLDDLENESVPTRIASRIQDAMTPPVDAADRRVQVTATMGIALASEDSIGVEEMLRDARKAVDRAKGNGRGQIQVFDPVVHARALAHVAIEAEIREAMEREELSLHYQPILELESGRIRSVEALLRWNRADGTMTSPGVFIPVAEETGLIIPMGWWTLETACRQVLEWRGDHPSEPPLSVSVNVSSRQFAQPDVPDLVGRTLERVGLPGDALHLELTETAVMEDPGAAAAVMSRLKELGVHVHIDDFGTGYSSLSYLCSLPIDTLKVDQAFIHAMVHSRENLEVVRTIIRLARTLGLSVVAEGVETEEQEDLLRGMECDYVQGYRYHKPLVREDVPGVLGAP